MSTITKESALEACIERHLTGGVSVMPSPGSMSDDVAVYQTSKGAGYLRGKSTDFKPEFAIDESKFWQFLETTQAAELAKLHYKPDWKRQILERLHREIGSGKLGQGNGVREMGSGNEVRKWGQVQILTEFPGK